MSEQVIGAVATIRWIDQPDAYIEGMYFSFGEYDEEAGTDSFGVPDDRVFFYAQGEQEMKQFVNGQTSGADFVVLDYQLERETND